MEKIRNLSLRKSIVLYVTVGLVVSFFLSVFLIKNAEQVQKRVFRKYTEEEMEETIDRFYGVVPRVNSVDMAKTDVMISEICDFLETWTLLIFSTIGSIATIFLFYRNKIKQPLRELTEGAERISKDDLEFSLTYQNRDEMGRLCMQFERMRRELAKNNKKMWEMVEQEKALRSAIAHDIRSPLSVLRGYQEMMMEFIPQGKLEREQLLEMMNCEMDQINRLNSFVDTMRELSKLEERTVRWENISIQELKEKLERTAWMMSREKKMICEVICNCQGEVKADTSIICEVYENLLVNALRYANEKIVIFLSVDREKETIELRILDDGHGFTEDFEKLTKAYYHNDEKEERRQKNTSSDFTHFGLGLYLCRMYCEKHGGRLFLENAVHGGADARARFQIKN